MIQPTVSRAQLDAKVRFVRTCSLAGLLFVSAVLLFILAEGRVPMEHQVASTFIVLTMSAWCLADAYFIKYPSRWARIALSVVPTGLTVFTLSLIILAGQSFGSAL
jgi:multisubunit Na+/H+ antiporter MnhB subunit